MTSVFENVKKVLLSLKKRTPCLVSQCHLLKKDYLRSNCEENILKRVRQINRGNLKSTHNKQCASFSVSYSDFRYDCCTEHHSGLRNKFWKYESACTTQFLYR